MQQNLVYISCDSEGIERKQRGVGFVYFHHHKRIKNKRELARIEKLSIPPAWEKVWICPLKNGHLQATGYDSKCRKQYIYHPLWVALRSETKFHKLFWFGKVLPLIRKKLRKDLRLKGLPRNKVLAALTSLMEKTNIRVGNEIYERLYGSLGLSTLKRRNVRLNGFTMRFTFTGKKGIIHDISIRDKRLSKIIRRCREIPGEDLFLYYDEAHEVQSIRSEDVNNYLGEITGKHFTSKDFRTWKGSVECIRAFKNMKPAKSKAAQNKRLTEALDKVAERLGNTRAVCKKYYVHPLILTAYQNGKLQAYLYHTTKGTAWMESEERILMKLLKNDKPGLKPVPL